MVSFTFSAEQIKAAPPDVRRWMEAEIVRALAGTPAPSAAATPAADFAENLQRALAAGTAAEMRDTFNRIAGNSVVVRMFFELAREPGAGPTPFHLVNLVDVMRHLHLVEAQQVLACLDAINQAFQQARRDPQASLFALDEAGHIYLHELTYHAIRQVWQQLVTQQSSPAPGRQDPKMTAAMRPEHAFAGTSND